MTDLLTLPGIGKLAKARLQRRGISFVEDLDLFIMRRRTTALRDFVHQMSLNPRQEECLEGYYPRRHNKRIKDGLVRKIKGLKPDFEITDYKTLRVFENERYEPVLRCDRHGLGPYQPYDDSIANQATILREGVAYRSGKSCIPSLLLTLAERDAELRLNPAYRNRRRYKCGCFRSEATCNDMSSVRGNRHLKADGRPKEPYCRWQANRCRPEN